MAPNDDRWQRLPASKAMRAGKRRPILPVSLDFTVPVKGLAASR